MTDPEIGCFSANIRIGFSFMVRKSLTGQPDRNPFNNGKHYPATKTKY
ncbi:hypothetical protein FUAX_10980 [Fulvitalea axinellae]|uniref:Uncharacterized protein n=1 Tax=Fulvitalea axinellae TaxID=1182444 RepID=A0AAU9D730_9BACT|nr:hypothetical protein FUAX_10980 [Fulvitalea axinellae]